MKIWVLVYRLDIRDDPDVVLFTGSEAQIVAEAHEMMSRDDSDEVPATADDFVSHWGDMLAYVSLSEQVPIDASSRGMTA